MKYARTLITVVVIGGLSAYSMYLGYVELAYVSLGALVGYLGKVNGSANAEPEA